MVARQVNLSQIDFMQFHPVQAGVLASLAAKGPQRFGQLRPRDIETNRFAYHLRRLVALEYLRYRTPFYELTPEGYRFASGLSEASGHLRAQPVVVSMLLLRRGGHVLTWQRQREPFLGRVSLPHGKLHLGELVAEGAAREAREKLGIEVRAMRHRGNGYLRLYEPAGIVAHLFIHLWEVEEWEGGLPESCLWRRPAEVSEGEALPGFQAICEAAQGWGEGQGFFEITTQLPERWRSVPGR